MNTARLLLYILSMLVAVALIFFGCVQIGFRQFGDGLLKVGVGLALVLLNSSRADRA